MTVVNIAAEGACDIRAVERIAEIYGLKPNITYDCRGKSKLDQRLGGFIAAGKHSPWIILRDLDNDANCAPSFIQEKNIITSELTCFRIAVRSVETWLFADREGLSSWLGVKEAKIPREPELILNPKQFLAQIAATSKVKTVKERLAARPQDGAIVGAEYGAAIFDFINLHWNTDRAIKAGTSPSLTKAALRISELGKKLDI